VAGCGALRGHERLSGRGRSNFYPYAYTYRDWIVKSLNDDMPYDKFVSYQLAADRLTASTPNSPHLAALGFYNVGERFINDRVLITDDRIDVIGRGLLGLTVGCARCHDHKFDPIPSRDYYAMYSILNSTDEPDEPAMPIIGKAANEKDGAGLPREDRGDRKEELDFKRRFMTSSAPAGAPRRVPRLCAGNRRASRRHRFAAKPAR
jgi:hypothetical protein